MPWPVDETVECRQRGLCLHSTVNNGEFVERRFTGATARCRAVDPAPWRRLLLADFQ
jgi:hypothetical protein